MIFITEQKENRELLTNILESVGEGFIVVDREMKIISANRAYCETMKEDAAAIVGRHCFEVSHRTTRPCYEEGETCPVHETFKTGQKRIAMHVHHDSMNQQKWVEVRSFPIMTSTGEVASVIEVINDVTEKRKLEEQLFRSQRMEAVGNLAGGIAHDFNNILTAIHGSCSLMDWEIDAHSPLREHTRIISEASGRAKELIKNLLAFSRKQIMNRQSVDLNRIVTGIQELLRPTIGENIELIVHKHDSLLTVNVDIGQIEQVLMNLAVNSRDAMPDGGTIAIELKRLFIDEDFVSTKGFGFIGPFALLTFMDSGHGMEEKIRSNIFEPFFTTKGKERGTGLGLSTVYGIIKQHGAFIDVATEQNKGTTFSIYIPLVPDESIAETKSDESPLEKGKETILVVEDEEVVRQITRKILAKYGYNIVEAADGQEAVETFRKYGEKIDLLLTDIVLPKKSGTAICDEIRELRPGLKVLFISGYSAKHSNNQEVLDQSTLFLAKPFTPAQLLQQVRKVLDS
jgi:PAS domain S-box-containing protein